METPAHFESIPQEIRKYLGQTSAEIVVAVAWFTDSELFDALCRQAGGGVSVRVAVLDNTLNVGAGKLGFARLSDMGSKVYLIPSGETVGIRRGDLCELGRRAPVIPHNCYAFIVAAVCGATGQQQRRAHRWGDAPCERAGAPQLRVCEAGSCAAFAFCRRVVSLSELPSAVLPLHTRPRASECRSSWNQRHCRLCYATLGISGSGWFGGSIQGGIGGLYASPDWIFRLAIGGIPRPILGMSSETSSGLHLLGQL
jgi:hypothetical protein